MVELVLELLLAVGNDLRSTKKKVSLNRIQAERAECA